MAADFEEKIRNALQEELLKAKGLKDKEHAKPKEPEAPLIVPKETKKDTSFKKIFGFDPSIKTKATKFECPENLKSFIPVVDTNYVLPVEATSVLVYALEENLFVNMVGPTGSGKSTLVEQVCAHLDRPFFRFNGRGDMETASLFGMMVVQDGATIWKDGTFTEAVKHGAVVLFDEYTATPPEINLALQWLREHGGKLLLTDMPGEMKERLITPHAEFRLVCADNTRGLGDNGDRFAGTNIQNSASLNRFDITIEHNYMSQKKEQEIITNKYTDITPKAAEYMVKLASLIRTSYEKGDVSVTLSPRNLLSWAKKAVDWNNMETAFMFTYFNMLPADSEKAAVKGFYRTVFDKVLKD
jgi:cobaltochelatase CobS